MIKLRYDVDGARACAATHSYAVVCVCVFFLLGFFCFTLVCLYLLFPCRFYWILYLIFFVLLPINAPLEYWDDSIQAALFVAFSLRYLIVLNVSWLVMSAHFIWGLDKKHKPSDSNMIFLVTKSYWPQYHYLLPFDYQTGEFGNYGKHLLISLFDICFDWLLCCCARSGHVSFS